jgi:cell shape-determining protein MreD
MKPRVYVILLFLIIPIQASLLNPLSLGGIKPDLGLAALYGIGLLTGPGEATLIGMALGLVQDLGSAGLIGFSGFTRGAIGFFSGVLGRHVLDLASPSNILFITAFSVAESIFIALFLEVFRGAVPFFGMLFTHMLPVAFYTGVLGYLMLRLVSRKGVLAALLRRSLQKE